MNYVYSVDFDPAKKGEVMVAFLPIYIRQEKDRMLSVTAHRSPKMEENVFLEMKTEIAREYINNLVYEFQSFASVKANGTVEDLKLSYSRDNSCGHSWYLEGKHTDGALTVCYTDDWYQEIIIKVDETVVQYTVLP